MSNEERQILEMFGAIIPKLSEKNKSYLLGLGEGMVIMEDNRQELKERGQENVQFEKAAY